MVHVHCTYSIYFPVFVQKSFKICLQKLFFPNFMGMLCNKDADIKNLFVFGRFFFSLSLESIETLGIN